MPHAETQSAQRNSQLRIKALLLFLHQRKEGISEYIIHTALNMFLILEFKREL